ncbi:hypothetical protein BJX61DRAFT_77059 [Aspergillus egyptiacus]|nr:hypothetical protein BJX61DRAFT_77059 [Aspergillus egyptiacus]
MDIFQQLPVVLVLSILHHTGDFLGVDSLLQVSPHVFAVFQSNSVQIIEDLLRSCSITAHDELHHLFYITALIHSPSFNPANFDELANAVSQSSGDTAVARSRINNTARLMVSLAAQIQHLACVCLSTAWDSFKAAHRTILPEEWQTHCEPFSWIEEFRTHRALWQLRIYSDLWNLIRADPSRPTPENPTLPQPLSDTRHRKWTWPQKEASKIPSLAILDMSPAKSYEIHSVARRGRNARPPG